MKRKNYNRAPSRLALAGLLAAISCSSFAQTPAPGTVAAAQAQSQGATPPRPAVPGARGQSAFAPAAHPQAYPPGAPGVVAPAVGDGRLKPRVIHPANPMDENVDAHGNVSAPGTPYGAPGMPRQPRSPQTGNFGPRGGMPGSGPAPSAGPSSNPFSPAGAMQPPPPQQAAPSLPPPGASSQPRAKKVKEPVEEGPTINLKCTTPDIKEQGVFVGKIQDRYIYKYKSQYCFDVTP